MSKRSRSTERERGVTAKTGDAYAFSPQEPATLHPRVSGQCSMWSSGKTGLYSASPGGEGEKRRSSGRNVRREKGRRQRQRWPRGGGAAAAARTTRYDDGRCDSTHSRTVSVPLPRGMMVRGLRVVTLSRRLRCHKTVCQFSLRSLITGALPGLIRSSYK